MKNIIWILIGLAALGFALSVIASIFNVSILGVQPEGFSRACNNLAVLAIALHLVLKANKSSS
ncbi:hypothetical protein ACFLU5_01755 [Bacteroidota bacterium]